jgi:hypothetical protein
MAGTKLHDLTAGGALVGTEEFYGVQAPFTSGTDRRWTADQIKAFAAAGGGGGITDIVQDTSPQLGGNLDTNGHIISFANGGVPLTMTPSTYELTLEKSGGSASYGAGQFNGKDGANIKVRLGGQSTNVNIGAGLAFTSDASLGWNNSATDAYATAPDLRIHRDAAAALAQRNGINPQTYRVYNTYTDASNYERLSIGWVSNIATISTEPAGTGVGRQLKLQASFASMVYNAGDSAADHTFQIAGVNIFRIHPSNVFLAKDTYTYGWDSFDAGIGRNAAGRVEVNNGTAGAYRDLIVRNVIRQSGVAASIATAGNATLTIANLLTGRIIRDCAGGARTDTLPTAALIVAGISGAKVGDTIDCVITNGSDAAETLTLAAGAGGAFDANQTAASRVIPQNMQKTVSIRLTNVGSGTEAYVVYA